MKRRIAPAGLAAGGIGAMHLLARQSWLGRADRPTCACAQAAFALSRVGPRTEHRLQHFSRRFADRASGTAAQRRGVSRRFGSRADSRPDHRRRFLSAIHGDGRVAAFGVHQRGPLAGLEASAEEFFAEALIDGDGTIAPTDGECKGGMDLAYNGQWGYHPLVISLANTGEPLYVVNRSGNRTSAEGAGACFDRAATLCRRAGFKRIRLRGDTEFSQTKYLDRWDQASVKFTFGIDASPTLKELAENLPKIAFRPLVRPPKYEVKTNRVGGRRTSSSRS